MPEQLSLHDGYRVGSPTVVVPWTVIAGIAGIAVLVPLFAGAVPYVVTRSRMEMVRRAD